LRVEATIVVAEPRTVCVDEERGDWLAEGRESFLPSLLGDVATSVARGETEPPLESTAEDGGGGRAVFQVEKASSRRESLASRRERAQVSMLDDAVAAR
jgi:hypothetical protein